MWSSPDLREAAALPQPDPLLAPSRNHGLDHESPLSAGLQHARAHTQVQQENKWSAPDLPSAPRPTLNVPRHSVRQQHSAPQAQHVHNQSWSAHDLPPPDTHSDQPSSAPFPHDTATMSWQSVSRHTGSLRVAAVSWKPANAVDIISQPTRVAPWPPPVPPDRRASADATQRKQPCYHFAKGNCRKGQRADLNTLPAGPKREIESREAQQQAGVPSNTNFDSNLRTNSGSAVCGANTTSFTPQAAEPLTCAPGRISHPSQLRFAALGESPPIRRIQRASDVGVGSKEPRHIHRPSQSSSNWRDSKNIPDEPSSKLFNARTTAATPKPVAADEFGTSDWQNSPTPRSTPRSPRHFSTASPWQGSAPDLLSVESAFGQQIPVRRSSQQMDPGAGSRTRQRKTSPTRSREHSPTPSQRVLSPTVPRRTGSNSRCKRFASGTCRNGAACRFTHTGTHTWNGDNERGHGHGSRQFRSVSNDGNVRDDRHENVCGNAQSTSVFFSALPDQPACR